METETKPPTELSAALAALAWHPHPSVPGAVHLIEGGRVEEGRAHIVGSLLVPNLSQIAAELSGVVKAAAAPLSWAFCWTTKTTSPSLVLAAAGEHAFAARAMFGVSTRHAAGLLAGFTLPPLPIGEGSLAFPPLPDVVPWENMLAEPGVELPTDAIRLDGPSQSDHSPLVC